MAKNGLLTLAQFKRDVRSGKMCFTLIERFGSPPDAQHSAPAYVLKVHSDSLDMIRGNQKSYFPIPLASLMEYTGDSLKIYNAGLRALNALEEQVIAGWKCVEATPEYQQKFEEQQKHGSSGAYYMQKRYFDNSACPYLFWGNTQGSKKLDIKTGLIRDNAVKGEMVLHYRITFSA